MGVSVFLQFYFQNSPYRTYNAASTASVAATRLHGFSQPQKTNRTFIFTLQRWIKILVITFRSWFFEWWETKLTWQWIDRTLEWAFSWKKRTVRPERKNDSSLKFMIPSTITCTMRAMIMPKWKKDSPLSQHAAAHNLGASRESTRGFFPLTRYITTGWRCVITFLFIIPDQQSDKEL